MTINCDLPYWLNSVVMIFIDNYNFTIGEFISSQFRSIYDHKIMM